MLHFLELLKGTIVHRPYVFGFFGIYLLCALAHLGWTRTLLYTIVAFLIALMSELSSTRNGFPFGHYVYLDSSRVSELWIANVPVWDSLSFVFLSYFSGTLAEALIPKGHVMRLSLLSGFIMMLMDIVIDPVALQGQKWFLGQIYYYPNGGLYFGVPLSNFAGWFFVGTLITWVLHLVNRRLSKNARAAEIKRRGLMSLGVIGGVYSFNLAIAFWIRSYDVFLVSFFLVALVLVSVGLRLLYHAPKERMKWVPC